ncbi:quinone-dependent dihydroorotate dehydrogenase [Sandaracinus amylolyticus]|nr:quinone-dependent dihydroorotate dehydrogenase [Sandaracinus amylolyticus]
MLYRWFLRPLLFLLPAETAHHLAFGALRFATAIPGVTAVLRALFRPRDPALRVDALGLTFDAPVGLAAGFDKNAEGHDALLAIGFGFVEIGTVTAQAQPGNPKPRMFRLSADRGLINRLGFNNRGAEDAERRLAKRARARGIVGVNVGKTKIVTEDAAIADYEASTARLAPLADYVVVNVSSPNTPGLRDLQAVEKLRPLLAAVQRTIERTCADRRPALLVKIAPDLSDDDVDAVADLALELGLAGIVATNTTIRRDGLRTPDDVVKQIGAGGLSGAPLHDRSLAVLRRLRARVGDRLVLVSVGGIETAEQAWQRIRAGATLVQLYTGFIYGGPTLPSRIARDLLTLAKRDGFTRVSDAIGADARATPDAHPR